MVGQHGKVASAGTGGNEHHSATYTTKVKVENTEIEIGQTKSKVNDTIQVIKTLVFDHNKKLVDTRYSEK